MKQASSPVLTLSPPAKLNLFFEVLGKRPDGYHEILTVTTTISLCDTLTLEPAPKTSLSCRNASGVDLSDVIPTDGRNLILKAASALTAATGISKTVKFSLIKRIPSQAGLGGGSSDAASALAGLNRLWNLGLSTEDLKRIGAGVGSDVPLFFEPGLAIGRGRGEMTESLSDPGPMIFVVVKPPFGLATAEVYATCSEMLGRCAANAGAKGTRGTDSVTDSTNLPGRKSFDSLIAALGRKDLISAAPCFFNRLEEAAGRIRPEIAEVSQRMAAGREADAVRMTGSGTAFYALCRDDEAAERLAERLRRTADDEVFVVRNERFSERELF